MQKKKSIIAIAGPTASGKSELAVRLAKKFNGEIISADSRQGYRGLDIGSGKVKGKWRKKIFIYKNIPHHCIDYVSPKKRHAVVDFQQCAYQAITDIHARGKIPFLVGGTGLYIDAVLNNTQFPSVPINPALRKKLECLSAEKLFAMLKKKDKRRAATIDPHNKRRLIRALEIVEKTKTIIPSLNFGGVNTRRTPYNEVLLIGIKKDKKALRAAITKRVRAMLKQGLIAETKKLRIQGLSWKRIAEFGFEYALPVAYLKNYITTKKELEKKLIRANLQYAKRQMTWFRHNKRIYWIETLREAKTIIKSFRSTRISYKSAEVK